MLNRRAGLAAAAVADDGSSLAGKRRPVASAIERAAVLSEQEVLTAADFDFLDG